MHTVTRLLTLPALTALTGLAALLSLAGAWHSAATAGASARALWSKSLARGRAQCP